MLAAGRETRVRLVVIGLIGVERIPCKWEDGGEMGVVEQFIACNFAGR